MNTSFTVLSTSEKKKKHARLKSALTNGRPLEQFTQEERDLLYWQEATPESLMYWTEQKRIAIEAGSDERTVYTDIQRRQILLRIHKPGESDTDNPLLAFLDDVQAVASTLPATH
jgi:hypothetical protein